MKTLSLFLLSIFLISCKSTRPESSVQNLPSTTPLKIYQPSILVPNKGSIITTSEGVYEVQTDGEVWHSDKRYRILERQIYTQK